MLMDELRKTASRVVGTRGYRQASRHLKTCKDIVEIWFRARGGGVVAKTAAVAATAGMVMESFQPDKDDDHMTILAEQGFTMGENLGYEVEEFFGKLLRQSSLPKVETPLGNNEIMIVWDGLVAGIWDRSDKNFLLGPVPLNGDKKNLQGLIYRAVWGEHNEDLLLTSSSGRRHQQDFVLKKMPVPSTYVGYPSPEELLERHQQFDDDGGRFILFIGPTGAGKTTLARILGHRLRRNERLLKISSSFIRAASVQSLLDIVRYISPGVILLDDVHTLLNQEEMTLHMMEQFHSAGRLVFATYMKDDLREEDQLKPGMFYFSGMRPGRIDEMIVIGAPNAENRRKILRAYMHGIPVSDELVEATKGLTGAYLKELASRILYHGEENWEKELKAIRLFAPQEMTKVESPKPKKKKKK